MDYQNRRDIDRIYDDLYDEINGSLRAVKFSEDSEIINNSGREDNRGTIDGLFEFYRLTDVADRVDLIYDPYPLGSVYQTIDSSFNPNQVFNGVWEVYDDSGTIIVWVKISETE